ncbi:MAG: hypothetical protein RL660_1308 [Bacteroidota bacterium]|jgi:5-(carboxyamino)imidazole ribonucleotide synthase
MSKACDIAIVGGGQLGKMLIEEGLRYNLRFATLDPELHSPAALCSHVHIQGSLIDAGKINELAQHADTITYEIEHVNTDALQALELAGKTVIPSSDVLRMIQDKGAQKMFYAQHGIPTAAFALVNNSSEWQEALAEKGFSKFAAKLRSGGYDGKGVALCNTEDIICDASAIPFEAACVLEEFIPCEKEISVIVARGADGEVKCFPPVEMQFDPVANLVTYLICPAEISEHTLAEANAIAEKCVSACNGIGLFAIEMFVTKDGHILVNEMAPRPHNSGHHTIEACYTSQYEQLLRVLTNKPLGDTGVIQPSAMINILGGEGFEGAYKIANEVEILRVPGVYIHMYNKAVSKPMRKLGHATIMAGTTEELKQRADKVLDLLKIVPA